MENSEIGRAATETLIRQTGELLASLQKAYTRLYVATENAQATKAAVTQAEYIRKSMRSGLIYSNRDNPKELGANIPQMEAALFMLCREDEDALREAEAAHEAKQNELNLAQIAVESLRAELRCLEAVVGLITAKTGMEQDDEH